MIKELTKQLEKAEREYISANKRLNEAKIENSKAYKALQEARKKLNNFQKAKINDEKEKKHNGNKEKTLKTYYYNKDNLDYDRALNAIFGGNNYNLPEHNKKAFSELLHAYLIELGKNKTVVFYMFFSKNKKSLDEIAKALGYSPGAVRYNKEYVIKSLKHPKRGRKLYELIQEL